MSWQDVPVPERMQGLPRDRRGYPVPDMIQRGANGEVLFTANDSEKVGHHLANNLCGICAQPLEVEDMYFAGGPMSAFHPHGAYLDGPLHHECGRYALAVCPYIAMPSYGRRIDPEKVVAKMKEGMLGVDNTMFPGKPECFVLIRVASFNIVLPRSAQMRLRPVGDPLAPEDSTGARMLDYEVWKDGEEITDEQTAVNLIRLGLARAAATTPQAPRTYRVQRGAPEGAD